MHAESYKANIIAITAIVEQVGIKKISHSTNMTNYKNTVKILLALPPVLNKDKISIFVAKSPQSVAYKLLQHQTRF